MSNEKKVAIIGGGASGLVCAARMSYLIRAHNLNVKVVLLEQDNKVGRPVLRSGNGRCNISNAHLDTSLYRNSSFVQDVFAAVERACEDERELYAQSFQNIKLALSNKRQVHADEIFFANRGLLLREENEGRLYPYPNKASVVLDLLNSQINATDNESSSLENIVSVNIDSKVEKIVARGLASTESHGKRFAIHLKDSRVEHADVIVFAAGGLDISSILDDVLCAAVSYTKPSPQLCPIALSGNVCRKLDNIRVKCVVSLFRGEKKVASEKGEVLFRKYGISGIATFNLSRFANVQDSIEMDLVPEFCEEDLSFLLKGKAHTLQETLKRSVTNKEVLQGLVLPDVADAFLESSDISPSEIFLNEGVSDIVRAIKHASFRVEGLADTSRAQGWRGGVSVRDIFSDTLESKSVSGLYFTGDVVDVDGPCGGYNLHFAWMSGLLAASSAIQ